MVHDGLNVLCVTSRYPEPPQFGMDVRVSWLLRCIHALPDVSVTLAAVAAQPPNARATPPTDMPYIIEEPDPLPASVLLRWLRAITHRMPVWMLARQSAPLGRRISQLNADVVVLLDDAAAGMLTYIDDTVPVVLDKHSVVTWLTRSSAQDGRRGPLQAVRDRVHLWLTREQELRALRRVNAVTVTSPQDAERLRATFGAHASGVVPSSATRSTVSWTGGEQIGVLGAMTLQPNMDGLVRLVEEGAPELLRLGAMVSVAGQLPASGLPCTVPDGVELLGFVDDLKTWLSSLAALVVPVWWGSGVKTKTTTAMAAGVPVVSTPVGVEGLDAEDGVHCLIRDTPANLLAAATKLRDVPEHAAAIGEAGQRLVVESYSVDHSAQMVRAALRDALQGASPFMDRVARPVRGL